MACWQTMSFVRSWYDQYMIIVVLAVHWVHVSWVMLIACPIMSPSCPSVLQPWTPPKETNETTGALILAVAGAVLGFSESSDELLILIDVSEDVISIVYVWWYDVIVCYSYTVIIHYNPIYIYVYHLHDVIFVVYCYVTVVSTSSIRMDGSCFCYDCRMPMTRRWLAEGCGLLLGALLAVIFSNHQHTVTTGFPVPHVQRHSWELGGCHGCHIMWHMRIWRTETVSRKRKYSVSIFFRSVTPGITLSWMVVVHCIFLLRL